MIRNGKNPNAIRRMFDHIANRYDIVNDILSFGIHRLWLKKAVRIINPSPNSSILDLASGTGKFAFEFIKLNRNLKIYALDFSEKMIEIGKRKAKENHYNIEFLIGDALNTPFPDSTFELVSMSYGIRNVASVEKCLEEIARVLKPTGRFVIVEFGHPKNFFHFVFKVLQIILFIPIGGIITGDKKAYKYLFKTIENFPSGEDFIRIVEETGYFDQISYIPLTFGIAYIYTARVKK
ncbi:MAG: bifunctional demethylmenaquinone methyltransferase/2-methoxy-6-polyprenyl-1,4-benzoquinol methylase UbiE [Candidatus Kapaibacteriales bacterium]